MQSIRSPCPAATSVFKRCKSNGVFGLFVLSIGCCNISGRHAPLQLQILRLLQAPCPASASVFLLPVSFIRKRKRYNKYYSVHVFPAWCLARMQSSRAPCPSEDAVFSCAMSFGGCSLLVRHVHRRMQSVMATVKLRDKIKILPDSV